MLPGATKDEKIQLGIVLARSGDKDSLPYLEALSMDPDQEVAQEGIREPAHAASPVAVSRSWHAELLRFLLLLLADADLELLLLRFLVALSSRSAGRLPRDTCSRRRSWAAPPSG